MRRQMSAYLCKRIVGMRQNGSSQKGIAQAFRITQGYISKILKRHWNNGLTNKRSSSGRTKNTTPRHDRYQLRLCRNSRTKPSSPLHADRIRFTNVPMTTRLVKYPLLNGGYLASRHVRKPLLQRRPRQARFVWAHGHLNWCDGH